MNLNETSTNQLVATGQQTSFLDECWALAAPALSGQQRSNEAINVTQESVAPASPLLPQVDSGNENSNDSTGYDLLPPILDDVENGKESDLALTSDDPRNWPPEWRQTFDERYSIMLEDGHLHPNEAWPQALAQTRDLYGQRKAIP